MTALFHKRSIPAAGSCMAHQRTAALGSLAAGLRWGFTGSRSKAPRTVGPALTAGEATGMARPKFHAAWAVRL